MAHQGQRQNAHLRLSGRLIVVLGLLLLFFLLLGGTGIAWHSSTASGVSAETPVGLDVSGLDGVPRPDGGIDFAQDWWLPFDSEVDYLEWFLGEPEALIADLSLIHI